jgi:NlpC/P60 family/Transglycosylase SLT domain
VIDQVEEAITAAMTRLGAPYVWATAGPDTFDCSGFTWWIACQVLGPQDYELRSSHHQFNVWGDEGHGVIVRFAHGDGAIGRTRESSPSPYDTITPSPSPRRGDLVFFDTMGVVVMGNRASHVGMMIDDDRFIHAANEELGVRIDNLHGGWYDGKLIGSGRIFSGVEESSSRVVEKKPQLLDSTTARLLDWLRPGPVVTPTPWNGGSFGAMWTDLEPWSRDLELAAAAHHLDVRLPASVVMLESQGIHARDGAVIEVWDHHPIDGPSVGLMQVKPWVWQYLEPAADAYQPAGNIRLGTAVLAYLIDRYGSWKRAIAEGYHPGVSPNGTTPARYVEAMRGLLGELGYAN